MIAMLLYRCRSCLRPWLSVIVDDQCPFCHRTGDVEGVE